jgi:signal transduction histidine kinase
MIVLVGLGGAAALVLSCLLASRVVRLVRGQAAELRALRAERDALRERAALVEVLEQRARIAHELYEAAARIGDGPHPGIAQLPALVERARAAGMPVTLHVEGRPRHVSPGVDLSAFRIVQEALNNAHRHARGAPATVRLVWEPGRLSVHVRDVGGTEPRAPAAGAGQGLLAMRERVQLHGGGLEAERLPGGGFEVIAVLPL